MILSPKSGALRKFVENDPIVARKWVQPKRCVTQHNSLCEICRKFFPNHAGAKLHCVYCNVVCHTECMKEFHKKLVPSKEWICFYCIDFLDDSKSIHDMKQMESRNFAKHTKAQIVIAKYTRRFLARSFFIKIYNLIVYMQVRFRVNKRKQAFHRQVQSKLRPFHIKIVKCSNLNLDSDKRAQGKRRGSLAGGGGADPDAPATNSEVTDYVYVVVTVLDFTKGQLHQTWRVTSDLIPLDDAHFTAPTHRKPEPLSAAQSHIPHLYTHVHHHHHPSHKHLHMDCSFLLGGVSGYNYVVLSLFQRGSFSRDVMLGQTYLDLSQGMMWKRGGVFIKNLEVQDFAVKDSMGMDLKTDFRPHPQGSIEFELSPVQGLCSGCGVVYGPCAEDLVRIVSLQNRFSGFSLPGPSGGVREHRKYTVGLSTAGYGSSAALHVKKSWIAIADGRIYMYSHFGDSLKLKINVEHFSFYATVRNKNVVYILRTPDFPDLEFHTSNKEEELRWKCAFLSTFRYKHSGTMVVSGGDTYDMRGLIKDLSLLEVSRYGGKDSPVMPFFSPTAFAGTHTGSKSGSAKSPSFAASAVVANKMAAAQEEAAVAVVLSPLKKPLPQPAGPPPASPVSVAGAVAKLNIKSSAPAAMPNPNPAALPPVVSHPPQVERQLTSISELSVPSLQSMDSVSSIASSSSGGNDNDTAPVPVPLRHKPSTRRSMLGKTLAALSGTQASVDDSATRGARKGVFDEIDKEIANIQAVKAKYKREVKEYKDDRRRRVAAEGNGGGSGGSGGSVGSHHHVHGGHGHHGHGHGHSHSRLDLHTHGGTSSGTSTARSTSRDLASVVAKAVSLQSIKEAVSDIYEAEEGILLPTFLIFICLKGD